MSKYLVGLCCLALAACAGLGNDKFSGESAAFGGDNILRNDVMQKIELWERSAFSCRSIGGVNGKIDSMKRVDGRLQSHETWTVQACGQSHTYRVNLREDERGETDFGVAYIK